MEPSTIFLHGTGFMYIADTKHHRIQKMVLGDNGPFSYITVANVSHEGGLDLSYLNWSMDVVVDSNEYMYIADYNNHRVVPWTLNSTAGECIAAGAVISRKKSDALSHPTSIQFDRKVLFMSVIWGRSSTKVRNCPVFVRI
ncbi:unnamed protein product [Rotaria sp. Silwood2]|nr:unnamed protein product [Rotaria sp. Silwood2]CAF4253202.1 unnamed protein product [Rotaria sp. Silwood2]